MPIGARIGDEDDLVVLGHLGEDGPDRGEELRKRLLLVVDGNDDRKQARHVANLSRPIDRDAPAAYRPLDNWPLVICSARARLERQLSPKLRIR